MASIGALGKLQTDDISDFCGCKLSKFPALPFIKSVSTFHAPFDLVHSDVWGLSLVPTKSGSRYYVFFFIDDHTRYYWVYLVKHCSEFFSYLPHVLCFVETQYNIVIKCFCCDLHF